MHYTIEQLKVIGAAADLDWRTTRKGLEGRPLRPRARARLLAALHELGLDRLADDVAAVEPKR